MSFICPAVDDGVNLCTIIEYQAFVQRRLIYDKIVRGYVHKVRVPSERHTSCILLLVQSPILALVIIHRSAAPCACARPAAVNIAARPRNNRLPTSCSLLVLLRDDDRLPLVLPGHRKILQEHCTCRALLDAITSLRKRWILRLNAEHAELLCQC
jgi:hypothetical protein